MWENPDIKPYDHSSHLGLAKAPQSSSRPSSSSTDSIHEASSPFSSRLECTGGEAGLQYPNHLTHAEYHELAKGSAIALSLIALNFFHLEGNAPYERLLISDKIPRLNT